VGDCVIRTASILILALFAVVAFENCSKPLAPTPTPTEYKETPYSEKVIGTSAQYSRIVQQALLAQVSIDLKQNHLEITDANKTRDCDLDLERSNRLKELLDHSSICIPGDLPPDSMVCLAFSVPDIELQSDEENIQLSPVICHQGVFLCEGNDSVFRKILADILEAPPSACDD
jgi:hypothetical protein